MTKKKEQKIPACIKRVTPSCFGFHKAGRGSIPTTKAQPIKKWHL